MGVDNVDIEASTIIGSISIVILFIGYFIFHHLAKNRDKTTRFANECKSFRENVLKSVSGVPGSNVHWENSVLDDMPKVVSAVELEVNKFKAFLPRRKKDAFSKEWAILKEHIEHNIPKALSPEEVFYGGQVAAKLRCRKIRKNSIN